MKWIYVLGVLALGSCAKQMSCPNAVKGKMKNLVGLDGCGFVIETKDKNFEPVNLGDFEKQLPKGNKPFYFTYEPFEGSSICMAGHIVKITCVSKKR
jgi:hypothetical protein